MYEAQLTLSNQAAFWWSPWRTWDRLEPLNLYEEMFHLNVKFMITWNDFATENLPNNSTCDAPFACKTCHHFVAHQAVTKIPSISLLHMSSNKVRSLAVHLGGQIFAKYTLPFFFTIFTTNTLHCTQKGNNPTAHSTCVQTHTSELA